MTAMNGLMREWTDFVRGAVGDLDQMTPLLKDRAIKASIEFCAQAGIGDLVEYKAHALLVKDQQDNLLNRIVSERIPAKQLALLNSVYSVDGVPTRLYAMTPEETEQTVYPELDKQQQQLNEKRAGVQSIVERCPVKNVPIGTQLRFL